ncbi:uncharacterized protein [Asterias amurensis]|uniref:uncharacterized protein isoform X2 n=1 Tax=Asterias amurensis TaxID=7602 RepID=UPI003AB8032D
MSRHRNVRGMDYGEDYEGYDDVYGHSVEEDYGVSPSTAEQFIFHRSLQHHQLASFLEEGEEDLQQAEGDQTRRDSDQPLNDSRNFKKPELSDIEEAQLQSCLEEIRNVVGDAIPEHVLVETALAHKFNFEKALNAILDHQESGGGQRRSNNNTETQTGVCGFMILRENEKKEMNISTRPNDHSDPDGLLTERNRKTSPSGTMQVGGLAGCPKEVQKASSNVLVAPLSNLVGVCYTFSPLTRCKAEASSNLVSSVPLSASAASHLSSSPAASGASQGRGPLSLSQLAGSRLDATKASRDRDVLTGSLTGLSLRDLSQRSLSSTPPQYFPLKRNLQTNITSRGGHTGEEDQSHRGISLSSLASSHLSSNPLNLKPSGTTDFGNKTDRFSTQSLDFDSRIGNDLKSIGLGNLVGGLGAAVKTKVPGAVRPMDGGLQHGHPACPGTTVGSLFPTPGMSLSSLASSHLASNLSRSQEKSMLGFGTGGSTTGISLSDLATTHLSSTPPSQLFIGVALESRHKHQSMVSTSPAGSSLFSLATDHLSQAPSTSTAFGPPSVRDTYDNRTTLPNSPVKMEQNTSEWFQTISSHQPLPGFEPARFEAPPGLRPLTSETVPPSVDELTPRVPTPPGFQSRESIKMESTSSGLTTNIETQDTSVIKKIQGLPKFKHSAKQSKSLIFSKPSVFARTLCAEYINQSPQRMKVASCRLNRLHSKPIKHRQFSYLRQKSWTESPADNREEVVVFDFSTPSPDDVVKQRQSGAFGSTGVQALAAAAPPRQQQPPSTKPKRPMPGANPEDDKVAAVTPEVAKMSFPSKQAKRGFELGPVPSGDVRRKSASLRPKPMSGFMDDISDLQVRSEHQGKLPTVMSAPDLTAMVGSTFAPPGLPVIPQRKESRNSKIGTIDISAEYRKRQEGKQLINLVVIGHVDAGKSTLMGHLLYLIGQVNQRQMHKYEQESKKQGKASFAYAWVLDETGEERQRGITMDVGLTSFETPNRTVTLLDAPGHKDFIPNMITGAAQADVAILVVDATRGEFETGFDSGGQTREHALLVRSLGVTQLAVAINKLDTVGWSEVRFNEIVGKLGHFLKQAGFKDSDVQFIPCSGLTGENLKDRAKESALTAWYKGQSLMERIDCLKAPKRPVDKSYRQCVSDVFKGMGAGISIAGKIESGGVQVGDKVVIMPAAEHGQVRGVYIHEEETRWACAGDHATVVVTGIDQVNVSVGSVMCCLEQPIPVTSRFRARVIMFNLDVPVTRGFPVVLHYQADSEPAVVRKLISTLHKSTGEILQKRPKCLTKQSNAIIEIETSRPVCLELYKDYKDLGRFMLRYSGSTIGAGVVIEIKS